MTASYYYAILLSEFWQTLIEDYRGLPSSRRFKEYNDHWHNDFLSYVTLRLGVDSANHGGLVTISNEQNAIMFQMKYGNHIVGKVLRYSPEREDDT